MYSTVEPTAGSERPATPDDFSALQAILEGTAQAAGEDFFRKPVQHLAAATGTPHALVCEIVAPQTVRSLALWSNGRIVDDVEYAVSGSPCEQVILGHSNHLASGVRHAYPVDGKVESYHGVPLKASDGTVLGHLCLLDAVPMADEPRRLAILRIFAARAAAELGRLRVEEHLRESEDRF